MSKVPFNAPMLKGTEQVRPGIVPPPVFRVQGYDRDDPRAHEVVQANLGRLQQFINAQRQNHALSLGELAPRGRRAFDDVSFTYDNVQGVETITITPRVAVAQHPAPKFPARWMVIEILWNETMRLEPSYRSYEYKAYNWDTIVGDMPFQTPGTGIPFRGYTAIQDVSRTYAGFGVTAGQVGGYQIFQGTGRASQERIDNFTGYDRLGNPRGSPQYVTGPEVLDISGVASTYQNWYSPLQRYRGYYARDKHRFMAHVDILAGKAKGVALGAELESTVWGYSDYNVGDFEYPYVPYGDPSTIIWSSGTRSYQATHDHVTDTPGVNRYVFAPEFRRVNPTGHNSSTILFVDLEQYRKQIGDVVRLRCSGFWQKPDRYYLSGNYPEIPMEFFGEETIHPEWYADEDAYLTYMASARAAYDFRAWWYATPEPTSPAPVTLRVSLWHAPKTQAEMYDRINSPPLDEPNPVKTHVRLVSAVQQGMSFGPWVAGIPGAPTVLPFGDVLGTITYDMVKDDFGFTKDK